MTTTNQGRARVRRTPDRETLLALAEQELSNKEIAEKYGVTTEAVRQAYLREGLTPPKAGSRMRHQDFIPWKHIRSDHAGDMLVRRLRYYSKRMQGKPLRNQESRLLDDWLAFMDGENRWGVPLSVHYSRTEGFWLEPRQPGDRNYIHPPASGQE